MGPKTFSGLIQCGVGIPFHLTPERGRIKRTPMSPALPGLERSGGIGLEIEIDSTPPDMKPFCYSNFRSAVFDKGYDRFS